MDRLEEVGIIYLFFKGLYRVLILMLICYILVFDFYKDWDNGY